MIQAMIAFLLANHLLLQPPHFQEYNSCSLSAVAECEYLLSGTLEEPGQWVRTILQATRQVWVDGRRIGKSQAIKRLEQWIPTVIVLQWRQDNWYRITQWNIWIPHAVCWVWMIDNKIVGRFAEWEDVWILWHFLIDQKAIKEYFSIKLR